MFDAHIFTENSCKNLCVDGRVVGYQLKTHIPYFRGIPLSMITDIQVKANGLPVPRDAIRFTCDGNEVFTLKEMPTVTTYKWEFGIEATIVVLQADGLPKGTHQIQLTVIARTAYIAEPLEGICTRQVIIN